MDCWKEQATRWKIYQSRVCESQVNHLSGYHNETAALYLIGVFDYETLKVAF